MRRVVFGALATVVLAGVVPLLAPPPGGATTTATTTPATTATAPAAPSCPQVLPGPRSVVRRAYVTLLRRCSDAAGAAAWESALRDGTTAETVARRIVSTPEARGVVVADAYRTVLARTPAADERDFWALWLRPDPRRVRRHDQLLAELASAPELWNATGRDGTAWVAALYERILQRPASAGDTAYWAGRLARSDRRSVARALVGLPEPLAAEVTRAWRTILGGAPTPAQRTWEAARLRIDGDRLGLSARLVGSSAFAARAEADALVVPGRAVALGDSYATGEGNEPWNDVTSPVPAPGAPERWRCGYADSAYPEVARTTSELVPGDLDVAACSGATLLDLYPYAHDGDGEDEPTAVAGQIAALAEGPPPDLVTLTIGGNDVGFVSIVQACLQIRAGGRGQHSPYYDRAECDELLDVAAPAALRELRTGYGTVAEPDGDGSQCPEPCSLPGAVADVVAAAPGARVLVVGYAPLMPRADSGCSGPVVVDGRPVDALDWYIAPRDVNRGRAIVTALNTLLRDAAVAAGATYVDPVPRFSGHEVCSAQPWIHGVDLGAGGTPRSSSFHPTNRGGTAVGAAVVEALEA